MYEISTFGVVHFEFKILSDPQNISYVLAYSLERRSRSCGDVVILILPHRKGEYVMIQTPCLGSFSNFMESAVSML